MIPNGPTPSSSWATQWRRGIGLLGMAATIFMVALGPLYGLAFLADVAELGALGQSICSLLTVAYLLVGMPILAYRLGTTSSFGFASWVESERG